MHLGTNIWKGRQLFHMDLPDTIFLDATCPSHRGRLKLYACPCFDSKTNYSEFGFWVCTRKNGWAKMVWRRRTSGCRLQCTWGTLPFVKDSRAPQKLAQFVNLGTNHIHLVCLYSTKLQHQCTRKPFTIINNKFNTNPRTKRTNAFIVNEDMMQLKPFTWVKNSHFYWMPYWQSELCVWVYKSVVSWSHENERSMWDVDKSMKLNIFYSISLELL